MKGTRQQRRGRGQRTGTRILSIVAAIAMFAGAAAPMESAAYAAEEAVYRTGAGTEAEANWQLAAEGDGGAEAEQQAESAGGSGEAQDQVSLFQAADGLDLRTYASQNAWYLGITKMEAKAALYTEKETTDYGGNVVINTYSKTPGDLGYPSNYQFAVINLALTKTAAGGESFAADQMVLTINGTQYERILADSFLTDHDYLAFPNSAVLAGSKTGDVVFAVPPEAAKLLTSWKTGVQNHTILLEAGAVTGVAAEIDEGDKISVPLGGYLVDRQFQMEKDLLAEYKAGNYSVQSPFLVRDPYGQTPLAAVAMFSTGQEIAKVKVTVKGKQAEQDITYEVESAGTEHEIPIIGLYAGQQNKAVLTALLKSGVEAGSSGELKSTALNTAHVTAPQKPSIKTAAGAYPVEPGLTLLLTNNRVVVDEKADVRWFQSMGINGVWGINELTDRGTFYFQDNGSTLGKQPAVIYEMTWTGKIIAQYLYDNAANDYADGHHDLAESIDGSSFLYEINREKGYGAMQQVDKSTGAIIRKRYISEMMTATHSLEVRNVDPTDWAHQNTITPLEDGTYLISLRNQHMVFQYNFEENKILWAFTPSYDFQRKNNPQVADKLVMLDMSTKDETGASPEWFYSQHHVTLLPDFDHDDKTMDILLFDNGADRSLTTGTNPKYSRIVHYRLDLSDPNHMTATQIYSAGKDRSSFYSAAWGSAQYLPKTGNYIGTGQSGEVTEFTPEGKVAWSIAANASVYRAFRISAGDMAKGYRSMGTVKGKAFMRIGEETPFEKTELESGWSGDLKGTLIDSNGIFVHGQQLLVKGQAYLASASAKKNVFLVADNGKDQYWTPLLSNSTASVYDYTVKTAKPFSTANLPSGSYRLGILAEETGTKKKVYEPTNYYLEKKGSLQVVQTDDSGQQEIVDELTAKAKDPANTLDNPVVVVNPFGRTPLSAMAAFYTPKATTVRVTVKGKPALGERIQADVTYEIDDSKTKNHVIPLIGLYPDYDNTVVLETGDSTAMIRVKTGAVSETYLRQPEVEATAQQRTETKEGLTFLTPAGAQTVPFAIDVNGDIRWAYMCAAAAPLETKPLSDGHFLVPSDRASTEIFVTDAETALEIDLAGRIYGEYFLDGMPHHEVVERANGNLIFALSRRNSTSIEDYMVEVERGTGREVRKWDFLKIFGIPEYDPSQDPDKGSSDPAVGDPNADVRHRAHPSIQGGLAGNHPYSDWFHQNSLDYDEGDPTDPSDDAIYVTARHQSWLVKINADKAAEENPGQDAIEWIYTDPSWLPKSRFDLKSLVLNPENGAKEAALTEKEEELIDRQEPTADMDQTDGQEPAADRDQTDGQKPITDMDEADGLEPAAVLDGADGQEPVTGMDETNGLEPVSDMDEADGKEPVSGLDETNGREPAAGLDNTEAGGNQALGAEPSAEEPAESIDQKPEEPQEETQLEPQLEGADGSAYPYLYGPHAVELMDNGDLIVYDNHLYGSKTEMNPATGLFSRCMRLKVNEKEKTFRIEWEYGQELGSSHYTPFIGDVDYLGAPLAPGENAENHYLLNFGGITKNAAGQASDVVAAMLGGTISANVMEYKEGTILWSAYFQGAKGKVSSVYRAERVNLAAVPFSSADYASYTTIENRGMYRNTPQASIDGKIISKAVPASIPVSWKLLSDEGNRLIGTFTLPHVMTDTAPEASKIKNLYVVLDLGNEGRRIYEAGYAPAQPALGVTEGYYKFEIMRDNKPARIQLLAERNDGVWLLGSTGEVAAANMQYATGDVPVIDPVQPLVTAKRSADAPLLSDIAAQSGSGEASLVFVEKGALEPGHKYVYRDPQTGSETDLVYSPLHGGYLAVINGSGLSAEQAAGAVRAVEGTIVNLRTGVVADDRDGSLNGAVRTAIKPADIFYLYNRVATGVLPVRELLRTLAMDVDGDDRVSGKDITRLIRIFQEQ